MIETDSERITSNKCNVKSFKLPVLFQFYLFQYYSRKTIYHQNLPQRPLSELHQDKSAHKHLQYTLFCTKVHKSSHHRRLLSVQTVGILQCAIWGFTLQFMVQPFLSRPNRCDSTAQIGFFPPLCIFYHCCLLFLQATKMWLRRIGGSPPTLLPIIITECALDIVTLTHRTGCRLEITRGGPLSCSHLSFSPPNVLSCSLQARALWMSACSVMGSLGWYVAGIFGSR